LDHHFLHQAVEGRIERLTPAIEQLQLHGIAAAVETLQPEGGLAVNQETVAVNADPQPPAAVVVPEMLEGGIEQQPVDQHWFLAGSWAGQGRQQLGRAGARYLLGVGGHPIEADLAAGARGLHHLSPGPGGVNGEAMAAWGQGWHRHMPGGGGVADAQGGSAIELHH
jgi:hypothetical protein